MQNWLTECRRVFGEPPRAFGLLDRHIYLPFPKPFWLREKDDFNRFFEGRERLLREGIVVWGHLIQANRMMMNPGPHDHGGEFVFCPDATKEVDPRRLGFIASQIFNLKGTTQADPETAWIANYLQNEKIRTYGRRVPAKIGGELNCEISSVLIRRAHLPGKRLRSSILPLVVMPQQPRLAMVVPSRYWPREMVDLWKDGR